MDRLETLPAHYETAISAALRQLGADLSQARQVAKAVIKLSDHYIAHPEAPTPWHTDWARVAYLAYYFPLNYLRAAAVLRAGQRQNFWQGLTSYSDFGSGLGTVPLAIADVIPGQFERGTAVERASITQQLYRYLASGDKTAVNLDWATQLNAPTTANSHLTIFSFSLTELTSLPPAATAGEALAIIEPATQQDGRRLLKLRAQLISNGWYAWAPCTHQQDCPLLAESARDWCHDRISWEAPDWFQAIEEHLPMRNRTLTMSYLLMRKSPPTVDTHRLARLTGDLQRQKGASKQMICRGPKREFLSWQHRHGTPPHWPRGALVRVSPDVPTKSNELRPEAGQCELV